MPTARFFARHFRVIDAEADPPVVHFRGTDFAGRPPANEDPGWETLEGGGRRIRVHGPFLVDGPDGQLECNDGWLVVDAKGAVGVEEA